ncbi:hypothetical protein [Arsukibacterium sp.]|uniref:hypothetical protein n=1 Tax=Arsukibacterium sp. TaxID=1977258 RepID=UPI001BD27E30|nr:hypothetical protein [Arsukibacterium sp.]
MSNSIQLGFMSVLLALVMYFAVLSFQKDDLGLEISTSTVCPGMCCLTRCETHKIEVVDAQSVRFQNSLLSPDEFAKHLLLAHKECEIQRINVLAASDINHDIVLDISNRVREVVPDIVIAWDKIDY